MAQFNKKGKGSKYQFWHSPAVLFCLLCLVVLFGYNLVGLIKKERETSKNKESELAKIDDLRARQSNLSGEIDRLNTSEGVEESIRDKYQVVKPGEKMVVIVDEDPTKVSPDAAGQSHGLWAFLKRIFGIK